MPNWCVGTLKVRGKKENLKKFVLEGLKPVTWLGEAKDPLKIGEKGDVQIPEQTYIINTTRGFVSEDTTIYNIDELEENDILVLNTRFAWKIHAKELLETAKQFSVDMKIYAFEMGQEFNQDIEIIDGKIIKDDEIEFDNYDWECICPRIGG